MKERRVLGTSRGKADHSGGVRANHLLCGLPEQLRVLANLNREVDQDDDDRDSAEKVTEIAEIFEGHDSPSRNSLLSREQSTATRD